MVQVFQFLGIYTSGVGSFYEKVKLVFDFPVVIFQCYKWRIALDGRIYLEFANGKVGIIADSSTTRSLCYCKTQVTIGITEINHVGCVVGDVFCCGHVLNRVNLRPFLGIVRSIHNHFNWAVAVAVVIGTLTHGEDNSLLGLVFQVHLQPVGVVVRFRSCSVPSCCEKRYAVSVNQVGITSFGTRSVRSCLEVAGKLTEFRVIVICISDQSRIEIIRPVCFSACGIP